MATSGSTDFSTSRDNLIKYALLNIGVIGEGVTPTATQVTDAAIILNMVIKFWNAKIGMPLWALKTGYILPISDTNSMLVSSHCVNSYVQTTIASDEASGQTTLSLASASGISDLNIIGIELDSGSIHWTAVSGAPVGNDVTVSVAITDDASAGNIVYAYAIASRISKPLRVVNAFTHDVSGADVPISILTHKDYSDIGTKDSDSYPTQLYYDPQLAPSFYWYPRFSNGDKVVVIRYHRPFEDFDAAGDEPDFPQEWYLPLLWYLSWALGAKAGLPAEVRRSWKSEAEQLFIEVSNNLMEEGSIFLQPAESSWLK